MGRNWFGRELVIFSIICKVPTILTTQRARMKQSRVTAAAFSRPTLSFHLFLKANVFPPLNFLILYHITNTNFKVAYLEFVAQGRGGFFLALLKLVNCANLQKGNTFHHTSHMVNNQMSPLVETTKTKKTGSGWRIITLIICSCVILI